MTSQQPTGHDKAVDWLGHLVAEKRDECPRAYDDMDSWDLAHVVLAALRAALAAGDPDVAEALGLTVERQRWATGTHVDTLVSHEKRRFVTDWTEA